MLSDCRLSVNTLSSMQAGGYYPRIDDIFKISDYLDVSIVYLLGRTVDNSPPASAVGSCQSACLFVCQYVF